VYSFGKHGDVLVSVAHRHQLAAEHFDRIVKWAAPAPICLSKLARGIAGVLTAGGAAPVRLRAIGPARFSLGSTAAPRSQCLSLLLDALSAEEV
jgi:hypothetical protein